MANEGKAPMNKEPGKIDAPKLDAMAFLAGLNHGNLPCALAGKLEEIIAAVKETGKDGKLALDITFTLETDYGPGAVRITPSMDRSKVPSKNPEKQVRFITDDNRLTEDDPRQLKLQFAKKEEQAAK